MTARRVFVTGSTRGIGRAVAEQLLAQGCEVILHGRSAQQVEAAVKALRGNSKVSGFAADLADRADVHRLAEQCGAIDCLINNAGLYEEEMLDAVTATSWARTMDVNVRAAWLLTRHLLPGLRAKRGIIVNVASDAAQIGVAGASVYCASKGALVGLSKALAIELAPDVRVLCVCPGPVETDLMRQQVASAHDPAAAERQWQDYAPLRRVAKPKEVAALIAFAAGPEAGFATGAVWNIDGGITAGRRV